MTIFSWVAAVIIFLIYATIFKFALQSLNESPTHVKRPKMTRWVPKGEEYGPSR